MLYTQQTQITCHECDCPNHLPKTVQYREILRVAEHRIYLIKIHEINLAAQRSEA